MDADGRIIPIVDDDQGEGMKDPLTFDDILKMGHLEAECVLEGLFKNQIKLGAANEASIKKLWNLHRKRRVLSQRGK